MMKDRLKIGEFVAVTGSTLKTVLYYHKIGLLPEPARSSGGYRLYGPAELSRMQVIKQLKSLGLDLKRTRAILGNRHNQKTWREVLLSLQSELLIEEKILEERVAKIEKLLRADTAPLDSEGFVSPSFQMILDILGPDKHNDYARTCPELFDQHRKVYGLLDDFQWGGDYQATVRDLAEFFQGHPQEYQIALGYGVRLARLAQLSEDDPEVEALARESAAFIKSMPHLRELLEKQAGIKKTLTPVYNTMVANILSPAQRKHGRLLHLYLASETRTIDADAPPALK